MLTLLAVAANLGLILRLVERVLNSRSERPTLRVNGPILRIQVVTIIVGLGCFAFGAPVAAILCFTASIVAVAIARPISVLASATVAANPPC